MMSFYSKAGSTPLNDLYVHALYTIKGRVGVNIGVECPPISGSDLGNFVKMPLQNTHFAHIGAYCNLVKTLHYNFPLTRYLAVYFGIYIMFKIRSVHM
jgi:hypothetical protein